jgi:hypothetical protein
MNMKKIIPFILTSLAIISAFAQDVDQTAYQRYVNTELYHQMVPGYYLQGNNKVEAQIKFLAPIEMQSPQVALTINRGKGDEVLPKSKIHGVSIDNHIYVPEDLGDSVIWVMLERDGAIRETIYLRPVPDHNPTYYKINHLVTNTNTHEGHFIGALAINFNKIMANLTIENPELSQKISDREQGYRFIDYKRIIAEYNLWIQNKYPKRVKYIDEIPDFQALIDNDISKYLPKND